MDYSTKKIVEYFKSTPQTVNKLIQEHLQFEGYQHMDYWKGKQGYVLDEVNGKIIVANMAARSYGKSGRPNVVKEKKWKEANQL